MNPTPPPGMTVTVRVSNSNGVILTLGQAHDLVLAIFDGTKDSAGFDVLTARRT